MGHGNGLLVGFQTRLRIGEQRRVFSMIPGLADAEFLRWGSIHRNSYLNFPERLTPWGGLSERPEILFAGQLTGVEGYTESAASGILAGVNRDCLSGWGGVVRVISKDKVITRTLKGRMD